jgi:hypothetical protein
MTNTAQHVTPAVCQLDFSFVSYTLLVNCFFCVKEASNILKHIVKGLTEDKKINFDGESKELLRK